MKRCYFGGGLLIVLLALSLGVTWFMDRCHSPIAQELDAAAEYALESDWDRTAACADRAHSRWERHRRFSAAFADHEPMEEIDRLFAELEVWLQARDTEHCATVCAELSRAAQAMSDAHALNWWNVL